MTLLVDSSDLPAWHAWMVTLFLWTGGSLYDAPEGALHSLIPFDAFDECASRIARGRGLEGDAEACRMAQNGAGLVYFALARAMILECVEEAFEEREAVT